MPWHEGAGDRQEVVASLRESGLSIRAIASATGASDQTVQRDLKAGVVDHYTPDADPNEPTSIEENKDVHTEADGDGLGLRASWPCR